MKSVEKITISMPAPLLREVERVRRRTGETRSAVFKRFVVLSLRQIQVARRAQQHKGSYRGDPEGAADWLMTPDAVARIWDEEAPY